MKKTINVNIGGMVFHLDDDAYEKCSKYIDVLKVKFRNTEGGDEIIADIELRIAELFKERLGGVREVVSLDDVNAMVAVMGEPESYIDTDETKTNTTGEQPQPDVNAGGPKRLFRNPDGRLLGGVCSGFGAYFNLDPWIVRVIMICLVLFGGVSFLLYFVFWIAMPEAVTAADKLMMHGRAVNVNNLEETIKREWNETRTSLKSNASQLRGSALISGLGKFFRISLGVFLIFICTITLAGFIWAMVSNSSSIHHQPSDYDPGLHLSIREGSALVFDSFSEGLVAYTSTWLLVVVPCVLFIYLGIRLILQFKHKMRYVMLGGFVLWLIGLVLGIYTSVNMAEKFRMDASTRTTSVVAATDSLVTVKVLKPEHVDGYNLEGIMIPSVDFDILKSSTDSFPSLVIERKSQGKDKELAFRLANGIEYFYQLDSGLVTLAPYFMLDKKDKYRGQRVDVTLYLPVGYRVHLTNGTRSVIEDIDNIQKVSDHNMEEHYWVMTRAGLSCEDCPADIINTGNEEEEDSVDTDDVKVNVEIHDGNTEVHVNK